MSDKEKIINVINDKLNELYLLCEKVNLSMIASVYSEHIDRAAVFIGGENADFMVIVREIMVSLIDDAKLASGELLKRDLTPSEHKTLATIMLGEVAKDVMEVVEFGEQVKPELQYNPVEPEVLAAISEKIEVEISNKLNAILIDSGKPLNKELVASAKLVAEEVLEKYFLADKIEISIHIAPDGVAEISFRTKSKTEKLH